MPPRRLTPPVSPALATSHVATDASASAQDPANVETALIDAALPVVDIGVSGPATTTIEVARVVSVQVRERERCPTVDS